MIKNRFKKGIIIFIVFFLFTMGLGTGTVEAALQANGNAATIKALGTWIKEIRKMEDVGGTLGLNAATRDANSLVESGANNLDIHMQKNSEYGAMAILSASAYGNQAPINTTGMTTTGNASGVVISSKEWVSAGTASSCTAYANAALKYKDIYTTAYTAKSGDALRETAAWHGGSALWIDDNKYSGIVRAGSGAIFNYDGRCSKTGTGGHAPGGEFYTLSSYGVSYASRACIVIGENF